MRENVGATSTYELSVGAAGGLEQRVDFKGEIAARRVNLRKKYDHPHLAMSRGQDLLHLLIQLGNDYPVHSSGAVKSPWPSDRSGGRDMVVVVFRSRLRDDVDIPTVEVMGQRMYKLAMNMPGFLSYEEFASPDGESLTLVKFDNAKTLHAWRMHPEHVEVQHRARAEVFSQYHITVCELSREYQFTIADGRIEVR